MAYNKDTYIEFHLLLWELLNIFRKHLLLLEELPNSEWHSSDKFYGIVWYVTAFGDALQAMAGGNIIKMHMNVIAAAHDRPRRTMLVNEEMLDDDHQRDHDLFDITNTYPTSKAYYKWLKLMVVHFDAVRILITHMDKYKNSNAQISINVVITPNPDNTQLPWKELLSNERYFEKEPLGHPTTTIITEFFENLQDAEKLEVQGSSVIDGIVMELEKLSDYPDSDFLECTWRSRVKPIVATMNKMVNSLSHSSKFGSTAKKIMTTLSENLNLKAEQLKGTPAEKWQAAITEAIVSLQLLKEDILPYSELKLNLNFTDWEVFKGSIRCELNLICFMMLKTLHDLPKDYRQMVDELSVSCVVPHSDSIRLILFTT